MLQNTKHYLWDQEGGKDLKNSEKPADSSYRKISLVTLPMLGYGFDPWLGTKIPHAASCEKKKKTEREREIFKLCADRKISETTPYSHVEDGECA